MNNLSRKMIEKMNLQDHASIFERPAPKEQQQPTQQKTDPKR